jgi:hypothetical protein
VLWASITANLKIQFRFEVYEPSRMLDVSLTITSRTGRLDPIYMWSS